MVIQCHFGGVKGLGDPLTPAPGAPRLAPWDTGPADGEAARPVSRDRSGSLGPVIPLQFIGGGRMAEALVSGLLAGGVHSPGELRIVEVSAARREQLVELFPGVEVADRPAECAGLVLATKPSVALEALQDAAGAGVHRVLSIAAGVRLHLLEGAAGPGVAVVRAMPNTPALVGAGAAAISAGTAAGEADLEWARSTLAAVGTVEVVPEHLMDAVTGLSGSGPAYVFLVAEALVDAGVGAGLPRDVADRLTRQTLLGAARLLEDPRRSPEELRAAVTSPGGTTAAGLRALEDRALRAALIAAVESAARRSAELG